jgi:tetratricopeptide (TPR) repeat protein
VQAFDRKDREKARAEFAEALRLDPNNDTATDYMARLADTGVEGGAAGVEAPYVAPEPDRLDLDFFDDAAGGTGGEAPLLPPDPGTAARPEATTSKKLAAAKAAAAPAAKRSLPIGAILAVLGILILGAGGWFVWSRFMNKPADDPAATQALFTRASSLAKRGQYDQAIALLQDVKPDDPQHDRALELIADLQQKKSQGRQLIDGKTPDVYYGEQLAAAQTALAAHDYVGAKRAYEQAMRVKPLPPELKTSYDAASQQVAKLDSAKALFAERKYTEAIANLQPLLDQDPQNRNIQRMISDAHFNLGAGALQEERLGDAVRAFDEVLRLDPNDELARRSRELAQRYDGQPKDLLYRIYVKYLPQRQAS